LASIFISYRRSDAAGHAGRLYDQLAQRFGDASVFKDLDSMEPGADFAQVIEDTVARCDALIAVIGSDWISPRLDDPDDWVRLEIAHALVRDVRVIPVLVEGAKMPAPSDLPDDLTAFTRRHAVDLSETGWHAQVGELLDRLEALIGGAETAEGDPGATADVDDVMANFRARMLDHPYDVGDPDGWHIAVLAASDKEREFELRFGEWRFPISLRKGRLMDTLTVEGHNLPYKQAKPSKYGLLATFTLRTPIGQSEGLVNWSESFRRLLWASVYVDGEPVHLESPGPLPAEAWPKKK
jgi:TIR domain